ncbi:MAG: hypothetical protein ACT4O2_08515 [Beijerinckiaceae bacterium]
MTKIKTETLSFRVEPHVKRALAAAGARERRSLANMIEVMVLEFCAARGIEVPKSDAPKPASAYRKNAIRR